LDDVRFVGFHPVLLGTVRREVRVKTTPEILTIKQVAELLQVSPDTVYKLAANGELRGRKIGRLWRFPRDVIAAYLRTQPSTTPASHLAMNISLPDSAPFDTELST
jgi:excisionase family DNA binding protein